MTEWRVKYLVTRNKRGALSGTKAKTIREKEGEFISDDVIPNCRGDDRVNLVRLKLWASCWTGSFSFSFFPSFSFSKIKFLYLAPVDC